MTAWLDGFKGGYYTQSSNTWHNYASFVGQFNADDVYFNQSLSLAINPGDAVTAFHCAASHAFSGSGGSLPVTARIQAIKNSTSLVTNAASALAALTALTAAYLDFSTSAPVPLELAAIVQEVVNDPNWATGNKITFVVQGTGGFGGTLEALPQWSADYFFISSGGSGGGGSAFLLLMMDHH